MLLLRLGLNLLEVERTPDALDKEHANFLIRPMLWGLERQLQKER
jgi:hypothetical protein